MLSFCGTLAHAKVDVKSTKVVVIPVDNVTPKVTADDVALFIPTDIGPTSDSSLIVTKIADKSVNYVLNNSRIKDSTIVKTANLVQGKMSTNIVIAPSAPGKVSHQFTMKYELFQSLAKIEYSGWLRAAFNYDAKASATDLRLSEKIFNKDMYLSQKVSSLETQSMVGLSWGW